MTHEPRFLNPSTPAKPWLRAALVAALLATATGGTLLTGCGGGKDEPTGAAQSATGRMQLTIVWPSLEEPTRVIPGATAKINVRLVAQDKTEVLNEFLTPPAVGVTPRETKAVYSVTIGSYDLIVDALDAAGRNLASARQPVVITANAVATAATLDLTTSINKIEIFGNGGTTPVANDALTFTVSTGAPIDKSYTITAFAADGVATIPVGADKFRVNYVSGAEAFVQIIGATNNVLANDAILPGNTFKLRGTKTTVGGTTKISVTELDSNKVTEITLEVKPTLFINTDKTVYDQDDPAIVSVVTGGSPLIKTEIVKPPSTVINVPTPGVAVTLPKGNNSAVAGIYTAQVNVTDGSTVDPTTPDLTKKTFTVNPIRVVVAPATTANPKAGTMQTFTATVTGIRNFGANRDVIWTATGGTIDAATGVYTAPFRAGTYTIRATSVVAPDAYGETTVTVRSGNVTATVQ